MKKAILVEIGAVAVLLVIALLLNLTVPKAAVEAPAEPEIPQETETVEQTRPEVTWLTYPADRALTAQQYFVYSLETAAFVELSGSESEKVYPASITKLFTAYTALQYLTPEQLVTVGDAIDLAYPGSSVANLSKGSNLTVEQLVAAMLLPSGNDAAYVLAAEAGRSIAGDPDLSSTEAAEKFVWCMNELAKAEGMLSTHFVNPDGIHSDEHYSSFEDLAILAKLALEDPVILRYTTCSELLVDQEEGQQLQWHNTNQLIDPASPYYCPFTVGLKTGQTPSAGSCLLSAFRCEDTTLIIGVFGCPDENSRFDDSLQLFNRIMAFE